MSIGTSLGARVTSVQDESTARLIGALQTSVIPENEWLKNLPLYMNYMHVGELLWIWELYQKQLPIHGYIAEFGCLWGRNLANFINMRTLTEPFNLSRRVIGFDTWSGFVDTHYKDGNDVGVKEGGVSTTSGYENELEEILTALESVTPISHIKRYELVKGDVRNTLPDWLKNNPHAHFSMVYLDVDLYDPSKEILRFISHRIPVGGVIAFDGMLQERFPGESQAVRETLGLNNLELHRCPYSGYKSYAIKR